LNSAEAIVPGAQQWASIPAMPAAVHGVGGILYKNAFYAIGGSLLAGGVLNQGDVQVFRWGPQILVLRPGVCIAPALLLAC
jgi:hypothetical protein